MQVSDYNKNRKVTEVAGKTWIDGTRNYLRPDTMWADDRYADITQADINAAKKRIAERNAKRNIDPTHILETPPKYDFLHAERKVEKPIYP